MTTFVDTFDGGSLAADWVAPAVAENPSTPSVGGGVASGTGSSARLIADMDAGVQTVTVVIPTQPADYAGVGLLFLDGSSQNGYSMYVRQEPGSGQLFFSKWTAGASAGLANEFTAGQSYPLTIVATYNPATDTFTISLNGTPFTSRSDSTYQNLTRTGFLVDSNATLTSFSADPVVGGTVLLAIDYSVHPKSFALYRP